MRRTRAGLMWALSVLAVLAGVSLVDVAPSFASGPAASVLSVRQKTPDSRLRQGAVDRAPGSTRQAHSSRAWTGGSDPSPGAAEQPSGNRDPRSEWTRLAPTGSTTLSGERRAPGHDVAAVSEGSSWKIAKAAFSRTSTSTEPARPRGWDTRQGRAPPAPASS